MAMGVERNCLREGPFVEKGVVEAFKLGRSFTAVKVVGFDISSLKALMEVSKKLAASSKLTFERFAAEALKHIAFAYPRPTVSHLIRSNDFCGTCFTLRLDLQSICSTILFFA